MSSELRAVADEWQQQLHDAAMTQSEKDKRERTVAALRDAADRLDAVQAILDEPWEEDHDDAYYLDLHGDAENRMRHVLTADTAPQESRDD